MNLPTVVIIGRTNVGKSAIFNRLTESGKALISAIAGTTRDYNVDLVEWQKKSFNLIDTGGVDVSSLKKSIEELLFDQGQAKKQSQIKEGKIQPLLIEKEIIKQTKTALKKADLILLVVDGQAGLLPIERQLALVVKKLNKPVILVCNKIDNLKWQYRPNEFFKLGLGKPWAVSAANGSGTGDLLDEVVKKIKMPKGKKKISIETEKIKVAVIGKPNVGKSSLVNKILGENRVIVSPLPQTTREPQDTEIFFKNQKIILIDTAGLRKKGKIEPGLEKMATKKTLNVIRSADVVLLVTEAHQQLTRQDNYLAGLLKESGRGIIIVANKWDLLGANDEKMTDHIVAYYQNHFPFLNFAPIIFISAYTGRNVKNILEQVLAVHQEQNKRLDQKDLNEFLKEITGKHKPVPAKGLGRPKIYSLVQTRIKPPEFIASIHHEYTLHFSYLRFLENQLRKHFGFIGTPIRIRVKKQANR
ncbi:MAG: ribosome biogenesis GTPase Der [Candidatus Buchananbacteria bacterium RIFCSPHIGHO2_01_FULL_39_14]|uniref:GTPase Der n=2 Tax=Candidatus Buchananiibacteriota TaxID=1817903 RepID=A0A1G1YNN2_9BACT|nr:MAG: ribosome biogenesis GTPase Der [Candidatus Buchananbacteria bacterium RIFCSPHIGHO2_01_FULL_39_14]OGY48581.1 MAG: ribosome biogenesis GTPase Der [Candidatus Buchananbacteria bacterium RIFCSPHIGHO2_02_FULL_39_17]OGY53899.1 MAG: ribosome biogenesis GTPase Der [Candidatus Buchananbacteria bacterium RIFCSPLOWO2_01_FULL_40_23b]